MTNLELNTKNRYFLSTNRSFGLILFSICYAALMLIVPWESFAKILFYDDLLTYKVNLEERALDPRSIFERYNISNILSAFTFEALWDVLLVFLYKLTNDSDITLNIISFFIFFAWGLITFRVLPFWWGLLFLINPISIDIALSQVRNGIAYAIFFLSLFYLNGIFKLFIIFLTPFIHSTSILLLTIYFTIKFWYDQKILKNYRFIFSKKIGAIFIAIFPGIFLGLAVVFLSSYFLGSIGDRRADIAMKSEDPSVLQSLFWYVLIITQLTCSSEYLKKNALQTNLITMYLAMNTTISWSSRIWAGAIPFIAISIWQLPKGKKDFILLLWIFYLLIWFLYWSDLFFWWNQ